MLVARPHVSAKMVAAVILVMEVLAKIFVIAVVVALKNNKLNVVQFLFYYFYSHLYNFDMFI
uniref:Uncharacterized protein n=1 Tax=Rhizophagus irregularis (strain DAOM 181602 / DAOM 197198 / MUCL 43194) TaxID=747089 RepID=U9U403_RHIID